MLEPRRRVPSSGFLRHHLGGRGLPSPATQVQMRPSREVAVSLQVRWVCPRGQVVLTACCPHVAEVTARTLKRGSPDQRAAEEGQRSW